MDDQPRAAPVGPAVETEEKAHDDEICVRVRHQIAELAGQEPSEIEASMTLIGNLALDSLQLFELAARLEDQLGLPELDEEDVASIETVGDVEGRVLALLARDHAAQPSGRPPHSASV